MSIQSECPSCQSKFRVADEHAGKRGRCPKCKSTVQIPTLSPPPRVDDGDLVPIDNEPEKVAHGAPLSAPKSRAVEEEDDGIYALGGGGHARKAKAAPVRKAALPGVGVSAKGVTEAAAATKKSRTPAEILTAFRGEIEPVRPTLLYRLWIVIVTGMMILLPMIYLALIGVVCYAIYYHAVNHASIISSMGHGRGSAKVAFMVYGGPLIAGAIVIAFMFKPIFAKRPKRAKSRALDPNLEPLLYAFVDGICTSVGAPRPKRIEVDCQVNASARLDGGALAIFKNDLVLTIGLPLAAGLSLKQFAGVLAHEFGHFSQGAGMRLYVLIMNINVWFARVVYERDEWDQTLEEWSTSGNVYAMVLAGIARLAVWFTRRILWLLMNFGRIVSGVLSRQMEFDADRYEARMVGSNVFTQTCLRLRELNFAESGAYSDLHSSWQQRRMPDNLPKLVVANVPQLPKELMEAYRKSMATAKTGIFDTHPCDRDRIAHAKAEAPGDGIFNLEGPASDVFRNFDSLSKVATFEQYRLMLGPEITKEQLFTVAELVESQTVAQAGFAAADRFFMGALSLLQPLPLPWEYPKKPTEAKEAKQSLVRAREQMEVQREEYLGAVQRWQTLQSKAETAQTALVLLKNEIKIKATDFDLSAATTRCAESTRDSALADARRLAEEASGYNQSAVRRLTQTLAILEVDKVADAIENGRAHREEARTLYTCAAHLGANVAPNIALVMRGHSVLARLLNAYSQGNNEKNVPLINAVLRAASDLRDVLEEFRWKVGDTLYYPFEHATEDITLAKFAMPPTVPDKNDVGALMNVAENAINRILELYRRALGRIALTAEEVERVLGLEPIKVETDETS